MYFYVLFTSNLNNNEILELMCALILWQADFTVSALLKYSWGS